MKWTISVTEPALADTEFSEVASGFRDDIVEEFED